MSFRLASFPFPFHVREIRLFGTRSVGSGFFGRRRWNRFLVFVVHGFPQLLGRDPCFFGARNQNGRVTFARLRRILSFSACDRSNSLTALGFRILFGRNLCSLGARARCSRLTIRRFRRSSCIRACGGSGKFTVGDGLQRARNPVLRGSSIRSARHLRLCGTHTLCGGLFLHRFRRDQFSAA